MAHNVNLDAASDESGTQPARPILAEFGQLGPSWADMGPKLAEAGKSWSELPGRRKFGLPGQRQMRRRVHWRALFEYFVAASADLQGSLCLTRF